MSSTFLTSIYPDEVPADRRLDWSDLAAVHRFVMSKFGELGSKESPRQAGGILFRLEKVNKRQRLLIQSKIKPEGGYPSIDISSLTSSLQEGVVCRFRLDVNPVQRVSRKGTDRVISHDEIPMWVAAKLSPAFSLKELVDASLELRKAKQNKIAVLSLDGLITIEDPEAARTMLANGVGRRKSHGCGLLTVIPEVKV